VEAIEHSVQLTRAGSDKDSLASALIDETAIYRDSGRLDDALKSVKEAVQVSRGACLSDEARSAMKVMATVHRGMGDADRAADDQRVANDPKDICADKQDEAPGQENKEPAYMTTHNMSIALVQMGMYPKAIENFKAELKKAEADHDPSASAEAEEGLGFAYAESSQFALAESSLLETERLLRQLGNPRAIAHVQTSLATLYTKMGRYYDALDVYEQIKRSSASLEDIQLQINTLLSTAELYRHLKSYDQAFADAQHALQLTQNTGFRNLMSEAQLTMALVRLAQENYEEAENLFQESAKNGPSNAIINEGLVEVRLSTGRYADAEKDLARVSPDVLAGADSSYRLQYYTQRGMARLGLGQIEDAISDFNSAIKESEEMRAQFTGLKSTGFLDSGSFGGRVRPYRGMLEAFATLAVSGLPFKATVGEVKTDAATAAFDYAELARGRSLTEKLALSRMDEIRKQVPASVLEEEQQLNDRLMEFARQHHEHPESPPTPEEAAEFLKLQNEARAHLDTLEKTYPLYARVFRPGIIPADELPLANDEALLEYAIGLHNVYVFVISHDHIVHCNELTIPVEQLEAKVRVFRNLVVAKRFSPAMAYDLFLNLMGGVPHYEELPRRLVIVPDGFLALLPFEALTTTSAGEPTFLGAAHSITYAQSAGILTFTRKFKRTSAAKPLFALGDPIFASTDPRVASAAPIPPQGRAGPEAAPNADPVVAADLSHPNHPYRRLAETQTEVETLASILGVAPRPPDVLTGADATKSTLQKIDLGTYRYLHFATHAAALGEPGRVNEPFLVLTQIGNPPGDDGLLKMSEIMDLKLRSDLVVLGACDTGEGDILEGDGVASLASAFQFAGAESVVLSLWELPSEAALPFMQTFYEQLKLGHSKTEALQMSRAAMRRQHADPYYWAVFALYSGASS
jgi:CHAT domain-containing protein/tetratricopeptide (TPR) repeat protein